MSDFDNIKEGDEIYIPGQYGAVGFIRLVSHVTPTTFTAWGRIFYKKDGSEKGGRRSRCKACGLTPEIRAQIQRKEMIDRLGNKQWGNLTDKQLTAICAILDWPAETERKA
jgi:hypothetical protein